MGRGSSKVGGGSGMVAGGGKIENTDEYKIAYKMMSDPYYNYTNLNDDLDAYMKKHPDADRDLVEKAVYDATSIAERNVLTNLWHGTAKAKYTTELKKGDVIDEKFFSSKRQSGVTVAWSGSGSSTGKKGKLTVESVKVGPYSTKIKAKTKDGHVLSVENGNSILAKVYNKK